MDTTPRELAAPLPGPVTVQVDAGTLHLSVLVDAAAERATAVLDGPAAVIAAATGRMRHGGHWHVTVPPGPAATGSSIRILRPGQAPSAGPYAPVTVTMTLTVPPGSALTALAGIPLAAGPADHTEQ